MRDRILQFIRTIFTIFTTCCVALLLGIAFIVSTLLFLFAIPFVIFVLLILIFTTSLNVMVKAFLFVILVLFLYGIVEPHKVKGNSGISKHK